MVCTLKRNHAFSRSLRWVIEHIAKVDAAETMLQAYDYNFWPGTPP